MKFLIIGDVVGKSGVKVLKQYVPEIIEKENIDFCIVNGENATGGRGLKEKEMKEIRSVGADVITMGNHLYYRKEAAVLYKTEPRLLIPANVTNLEGKGYCIVEKCGKKIAVINLLGKVYLYEINGDFIADPFKTIKEVVKEVKEKGVDYIFLDFHAEATAEKKAMGQFLKHDITCMFGTHTHVQTSDAEVLDTGMAYITDVGMTGPKNSVIGLRTDIALERFLTGEKIKYECSEEPGMLNGIIVDTDDNTNKAISIKRVVYNEN